MRRIALVIPFLFACSSKPQPQTTPAEEETTEETTEEAADPEECADLGCYHDCMDELGDTATCDADCCVTDDMGDATEYDICLDECMSEDGADADECNATCEGG